MCVWSNMNYPSETLGLALALVIFGSIVYCIWVSRGFFVMAQNKISRPFHAAMLRNLRMCGWGLPRKGSSGQGISLRGILPSYTPFEMKKNSWPLLEEPKPVAYHPSNFHKPCPVQAPGYKKCLARISFLGGPLALELARRWNGAKYQLSPLSKSRLG